MFFNPGFWVMIAGAIICGYGFLGLAFSRMGHELPSNNADKSPKREEQPGESEIADLPNLPSTNADRNENTKPKR